MIYLVNVMAERGGEAAGGRWGDLHLRIEPTTKPKPRTRQCNRLKSKYVATRNVSSSSSKKKV